jgi:hypothetical protein
MADVILLGQVAEKLVGREQLHFSGSGEVGAAVPGG